MEREKKKMSATLQSPMTATVSHGRKSRKEKEKKSKEEARQLPYFYLQNPQFQDPVLPPPA
jgi:hypothetical protein